MESKEEGRNMGMKRKEKSNKRRNMGQNYDSKEGGKYTRKESKNETEDKS